ncbi:thiamine phosphate synthase [Mangrovicella endophytica]|uniref:thiamine phosphate synthase n=1 Tax=Mangrovicella endophytica TaxID=2066697 RepID=UPI000C9E87D8|nr:thiamine phosphate synthase [Mangrovicella endophytica]
MSDALIRPRLVLITTPLPDGAPGEDALRAALSGGDVASVIIDPAGRDEAAFQRFAEALVPIAQDAGAAAIVVDDTRCAGRVRADGLHVASGTVEALQDAIARFSPKLIVGGSGFETRHEGLEAGEFLPDYLMFGRLGGDAAEEPHAKNLELGEWWAAVVEIPCIVMAGGNVESARAAAATGAEFVALSSAVFAEGSDTAAQVARANAIFDEIAEGVAA